MNISRIFGYALLLLLLNAGRTNAQPGDFRRATIIAQAGKSIYLRKIITVFREEIYKRTSVDLPVTQKLAFLKDRYFLLATDSQLAIFPGKVRQSLSQLPVAGKDGFRVCKTDSNIIAIVGHDERGLLYGIGYVLRKMELRPGRIYIPDSLSISSTPNLPIRGHQLGYRPKTNAYDAWTVEQFDTYIRQLALFGANSIEILPPVTDDDFTNEHMRLPAIKMIAEQSRICKEYGLDVWMWYPNMGNNYVSPDSIKVQLAACEEVFKVLPKLDALFVPGGDPGELEPDVLFNFLAQEATILHKYHPNAKIWVSPQVFRPTQQWFDAFYKQVNTAYPWFGGVVYGPWIKQPLRVVREQVKKEIPIRLYPDITHSLSCQYPVPHWDPAFAITLGRECYNPRPTDEKHIHDLYAKYSQGSLSYSEGINDDVNKFVWTGQDWDSTRPVIETLRDYARFFIGSDFAEPVAQGILALENNFRGSLLLNSGVQRTLQQWQDMEKKNLANSNFRFQMLLLRAYYDAYIQRRLMYETELEQQAKDILSAAPLTGTQKAFAQAQAVLRKAIDAPVQPLLRERCQALADSVYANIGSQLTVSKHGAAAGRGNFIDNIDLPLNNASWLVSQFAQIEMLGNEPLRVAAVEKLLHRTDPGPGGFYDDLGSDASSSRVISATRPVDDPGGLESPLTDFGVFLKGDEWVDVLPVGFEGKPVPLAWMDQVTTLYNTPLTLHYDHLDPMSKYTIRIAYTGRFTSSVKLVADQKYLVHDYLKTGEQPLYEFPIPIAALADGTVDFTFSCLPDDRGTQVAEVWLLRQP